MKTFICTHTGDWWKEMLPCVCCGAPYSDEEAENIARRSSTEYLKFTEEQKKLIAHLMKTKEDND